MFDIEKELNEIRSISVSPAIEIIKKTKNMVNRRMNELEELKKAKIRKNIIKFTSFAALPAAAAVLLAVVIGLAIPKAAAHYSLDMGVNMAITVDSSGRVVKTVLDENEAWDGIDAAQLKGESVEYAISEAIAAAAQGGYIADNQNILIGCFGEDEYNNISRNRILSCLGREISGNINLMAVYGSADEWKEADNINVSPGMYVLASFSKGIQIDSDTQLDSLISSIEAAEKSDINTIVEINAEPVKYTAPEISYSISGKYIIFTWDYIDYKKYNYDGDITYLLISADSKESITAKPDIEDIYTFAAWEKQPLDYTMFYDESTKGRYYAVIAVYDDGTRAVNDSYVFVP